MSHFHIFSDIYIEQRFLGGIMKKFFAVVIMMLVISQSVIGIEGNVNLRNFKSDINLDYKVEDLPKITWEELEGVLYDILIETDDYVIIIVGDTIYVIDK